MTVEITAKVAPSASLDAINTIIAQTENKVGALKEIGTANGFTTLAFEVGDKPANHAIVAQQQDGQPVVPPGSSLVCTGVIFVVGQLSLCAATRPD